ncbi:MAG: DUF465 domain-containing protein [Acidobacteriota bacterium]|nr:DUF465 domain-containing protein [Acidobacteriota bacterium]
MNAPVREEVLAGNEELQRLAAEHSNYSQRLELLTNKKYLSEDEKVEEVKLKKLKLRLKDEIATLQARALPVS